MLGAGYTGSGVAMLAGLRWAIEQGFDVVNMSLSTTKKQYVDQLHELADRAYFRTATVRALDGLRLQAIERDDFIAAVTGHAPSLAAAESAVVTRLPAGALV